MQEQRFTLASGNSADITPGVLRIMAADGTPQREFDLAYLSAVQRDGATVHAVIAGERISLPTASLVVAGQLEASLKPQVTRTPQRHVTGGDAPQQQFMRDMGIDGRGPFAQLSQTQRTILIGLLIVAAVIVYVAVTG